jgi:hypothetical protein
VNPFDDIQPLSGLDVEEASCCAFDGFGGSGAFELSLQRVVLRAKNGDPSVLAANELALVVVGTKRPRIEESNQNGKHQHDEPARARPLSPTVGARGSSGLRSLSSTGHGLKTF